MLAQSLAFFQELVVGLVNDVGIVSTATCVRHSLLSCCNYASASDPPRRECARATNCLLDSSIAQKGLSFAISGIGELEGLSAGSSGSLHLTRSLGRAGFSRNRHVRKEGEKEKQKILTTFVYTILLQ